MFVVIIKNKVRLEGKEDYLKASKLFAGDMKNVEGCCDALVLDSIDENDVVVNLELWNSKEDFDRYDGSVFMKHKSNLKPNFLGNTTELYNL